MPRESTTNLHRIMLKLRDRKGTLRYVLCLICISAIVSRLTHKWIFSLLNKIRLKLTNSNEIIYYVYKALHIQISSTQKLLNDRVCHLDIFNMVIDYKSVRSNMSDEYLMVDCKFSILLPIEPLHAFGQ